MTHRSPYAENPGHTHFESCERHRGHHNCALKLLDEARAEVRSLHKLLADARAEVASLRRQGTSTVLENSDG